jgi:putative transposase
LIKEKRTLIEPRHSDIPISRQCELVGLSRAAYYYEPMAMSALNLELMRLIDEQYTRTPFYGVEKMTEWLRRQEYGVNPKRVRRLLRLMGLEAVYPKPWLSKPAEGHKKYPYLLKGLLINRPDQVWTSDITYIRLLQGFVYLVAIMDWFSRYVLAWEISTTLEREFCLEALERALLLSRPDIFNSDQGSQFTSTEFTGRLEGAGVRISMDGRSRVWDNIFVERLWRTVKYEEVYLKSYETVKEARAGLAAYFHFYNNERLHESLGYRTPKEVYLGRQCEPLPMQANPLHLKKACFLS